MDGMVVMDSVYERRVWSLVVRRDRAEIERLVALYLSSGMGRSEFSRRHGIGLSTLSRHLKERRIQQSSREAPRNASLVGATAILPALPNSGSSAWSACPLETVHTNVRFLHIEVIRCGRISRSMIS
jgi:transposase-like protein